jgi:hypothetical protein
MARMIGNGRESDFLKKNLLRFSFGDGSLMRREGLGQRRDRGSGVNPRPVPMRRAVLFLPFLVEKGRRLIIQSIPPIEVGI